MTTIHPASMDWLKAGGLGASTSGAKTILIANVDGDVLMSKVAPLLFAHVGDPPQAGADVRCSIAEPIVGVFVRAELVESVSLRAPLYYWVLSDIRREPGVEFGNG